VGEKKERITSQKGKSDFSKKAEIVGREGKTLSNIEEGAGVEFKKKDVGKTTRRL